MSNEVAERKTVEQTMIEIQRVADETSIAKLHDLPQTTRALKLVQGLRQLRKLFDGQVISDIMELMDTPLGFCTDRPPGTKDKAGNPAKPYPVSVVRDCVIEGMLRGANLIGNEINVITGKCYLTKNYYERVVRELVSDLRVVEGVPQLSQGGGGAYVPMRASWVHNGHRDSIECIKTADEDRRIPVRVNAGMGSDAILGKAHRKLFAKIHRRVTGSTWLEEETDGSPGDSVTVEYTVNEEPQQEPTEDAVEAPEQPVAVETSGDDGCGQVDTQDPEQQNSVLAGIQSILEGLDQITDVDAYEAKAAPLCLDEAEAAKLREWCDWRREQIRETRGTRSNRKQKQEA